MNDDVDIMSAFEKHRHYFNTASITLQSNIKLLTANRKKNKNLPKIFKDILTLHCCTKRYVHCFEVIAGILHSIA